MKPASAKLKRDLFQRKNEIGTLKRELIDIKKEYKKLNINIKRITEEIVELPMMQDKTIKLKNSFTKKQNQLKNLVRLEEEEQARLKAKARKK